MAADLDVTLSSAGFLITAFALGVVLGGPPFAVLSLRWPRRTTLVATQGLFAASIVVGLLGGYHVLLLTRVASGVAYAGFFAVASVTAISLVTPDHNARASGVVVSGLSVAMVAGGPAGTLFSHFTGWRGGGARRDHRHPRGLDPGDPRALRRRRLRRPGHRRPRRRPPPAHS